MDILIKNMEMPKSCDECPFFDGSWCNAQPMENWRTSYFRPSKGERQESCPLIPVPEHGDLIDRDKEIEEWEQTRRILSECEQKHTFEYRKACVVINALSQAEVVLERTT